MSDELGKEKMAAIPLIRKRMHAAKNKPNPPTSIESGFSEDPFDSKSTPTDHTRMAVILTIGPLGKETSESKLRRYHANS